MQKHLIAATSCLITPDKIGELHLLHKLYGKIFTTRIVASEFGKELPYWLEIKNPSEKNTRLPAVGEF